MDNFGKMIFATELLDEACDSICSYYCNDICPLGKFCENKGCRIVELRTTIKEWIEENPKYKGVI